MDNFNTRQLLTNPKFIKLSISRANQIGDDRADHMLGLLDEQRRGTSREQEVREFRNDWDPARLARIEDAKRGGTFDDMRQAYNSNADGTNVHGSYMDSQGIRHGSGAAADAARAQDEGRGVVEIQGGATGQEYAHYRAPGSFDSGDGRTYYQEAPSQAPQPQPEVRVADPAPQPPAPQGQQPASQTAGPIYPPQGPDDYTQWGAEKAPDQYIAEPAQQGPDYYTQGDGAQNWAQDQLGGVQDWAREQVGGVQNWTQEQIGGLKDWGGRQLEAARQHQQNAPQQSGQDVPAPSEPSGPGGTSSPAVGGSTGAGTPSINRPLASRGQQSGQTSLFGSGASRNTGYYAQGGSSGFPGMKTAASEDPDPSLTPGENSNPTTTPASGSGGSFNLGDTINRIGSSIGDWRKKNPRLYDTALSGAIGALGGGVMNKALGGGFAGGALMGGLAGGGLGYGVSPLLRRGREGYYDEDPEEEKGDEYYRN